MTRIRIDNPLVVALMDDARTEFSGGHILMEDGVVVSAGPEPSSAQADEVIDASMMLVLPGFINTHHHLYQSLTRNIPRMQDVQLFPWLVDHYEVWRELTVEAVDVSARIGLLELMKTGVTTSTDHLYVFPRKTDNKLIDAEIAAARELGVRFQPTRGSMSLGQSAGGLPPDDVTQTEHEIIEDTERLLDLYHDPSPGAMVRISLAPCSPFSVSPEEMKATARLARDRGLQIHTHLAETLDEEKFCLETYGMRPLAYMESLDWISDNAWFAHSIHLNDEEVETLARAGASISHCPNSNMRLGSGISPVKKLLNAGAGVSLGVDGSASNDSSNMLAEIRNALLLSRLRPEEEWLTARDVLAMATRGGARALGRDDIGSLEAGKRADVALFDMSGIEYAGGLSDPLAALVFGVRMKPVDWLIVNGEILIREAKSKVDESTLAKKQRALSGEMIRAAEKRTGKQYNQAGVER